MVRSKLIYWSGCDWWITIWHDGQVLFSSKCFTRQLLQTEIKGNITVWRFNTQYHSCNIMLGTAFKDATTILYMSRKLLNLITQNFLTLKISSKNIPNQLPIPTPQNILIIRTHEHKVYKVRGLYRRGMFKIFYFA